MRISVVSAAVPFFKSRSTRLTDSSIPQPPPIIEPTANAKHSVEESLVEMYLAGVSVRMSSAEEVIDAGQRTSWKRYGAHGRTRALPPG